MLTKDDVMIHPEKYLCHNKLYLNFNLKSNMNNSKIKFESGHRYTRSIQDTIIFVNEQSYYDSPREDDHYVSKTAKKNIVFSLGLIFLSFISPTDAIW